MLYLLSPLTKTSFTPYFVYLFPPLLYIMTANHVLWNVAYFNFWPTLRPTSGFYTHCHPVIPESQVGNTPSLHIFIPPIIGMQWYWFRGLSWKWNHMCYRCIRRSFHFSFCSSVYLSLLPRPTISNINIFHLVPVILPLLLIFLILICKFH